MPTNVPIPLPASCVVLFDIDGVLVDVRPSYHRVIVETVVAYVQRVLALPAPPNVVGEAHVAALKRVGGFNNDWNTVAAMLYVLLAHLPATPPPREATVEGVRAAARALATLPDLATRLQRGAAHLLALEPEARRRGGGLSAIRALTDGRNAHLVLYPPTLTPERNLIVRLYQERYLGPRLFEAVHGMPAVWFHEPGRIDAETALVPVEIVAALARRFPLGVVTGRPRAEAVYALERLGFWPYFRVLVSHDEVVAEMQRRGTQEPLGKPHPWPLQHAADLLDPSGHRAVVFIGDTVDDIRAARRLRDRRESIAVGCTWAYEDPDTAAAHLREAGADVIVSSPAALLSLWEPG